jgi:hypothetical protein
MKITHTTSDVYHKEHLFRALADSGARSSIILESYISQKSLFGKDEMNKAT